MENANKALVMAGSTLLAVMLFAVFTFFIKEISIWPEAQDEMLSTEQRTNFNEEYEVYEKSLMYGVDVISCLNKAKSNNDKYEKGGGFLSGDAYGIEYHIDVFVRLDDGNPSSLSCLSETIEVYYFDQTTNKERQRFSGRINSVYGEDLSLGTLFKGPFCDSSPREGYTLFKESDTLAINLDVTPDKLTHKLNTSDYMVENGGSYSLTKDGTTKTGYYSLENDDELKNILEYSGENMKQTIKHTFNSTVPQREREEGLKYWSSAIWKTALYDFKKRRFTCDDIKYSDSTGLVNEIWFSEK